MMGITALIIAHNEADNIAACIDSLREVADEILVIDSYSTDATAEVAKAKGARVEQLSFRGFGEQKNEGARLATYPYILSIDADERLSPELTKSLLVIKKQATPTTAYSMNRRNYLGDRPIYSCGWYPDQRVRLYHRKYAHWDQRVVHERLLLSAEVIDIAGDILHHSYSDLEAIPIKSNRYALMAAAENRNKNKLVLLAQMIASPIAKLIKAYLLQRGIMDGKTGLMISYYQARETLLKYYWALKYKTP